MSAAVAHGTRRSYQAGCRCVLCRAANADYVRSRRTDWLPDPTEMVSAAPARAYLLTLRIQGVGYRQAATIARLDPGLIQDIRKGARTQIRAVTSTRILGIRPQLALGQRVTAWRTWRLLDSLKREGFSRADLARKLGLQDTHLQLHARHVRVKNACKVRNLWHFIMAEDGGALVIEDRPE